MSAVSLSLDVPNLPDGVRGAKVVVGWDDSWGDPHGTAAVECPDCGDPRIFHLCAPLAYDRLEFFSGLVLTSGDWQGELFEPLGWAAEMLVMTSAPLLFDEAIPEKMGGPRHVRLMQEFIGSITRGGFKTEVQCGLMCEFIANAPAGSEGIFAQQNNEEALAKLVPRVLYMIEHSPVLQGVDISWIGTSRKPGGKQRFVRNLAGTNNLGEVNLRLASPQRPETAKGYRYSFGVFDEVGFMPDKSAEMLIEEAAKDSNMKADPQWYQFSTQASDSTHYQRRMVSIAQQVAKQPEMNPRLWSRLYVRGLDTDIDDPAVWKEMSPLLEHEIAPISIWEQENRACQFDAALRTIFARERCGVTGDFSAQFIPKEHWDACGVDGGRAAILDRMRGMRVFAGCDFSQLSDLSSFVLLAIDENGKVWVVAWHWIPSAAVVRLDALTRGAVSEWIADGWLEELPAGEEMPLKVGARCLQLVEPLREEIVRWGFDRHFASEAAALWRDAGWAEDDRVVTITQGPGLTEPIQEAVVKAQYGLIAHCRDPVLTYCVLCAKQKRAPVPSNPISARSPDPDKVMLVKPHRDLSAERIDGAIAWMTAWQTAKYTAYLESAHVKTTSIPEPYLPPDMREADRANAK